MDKIPDSHVLDKNIYETTYSERRKKFHHYNKLLLIQYNEEPIMTLK